MRSIRVRLGLALSAGLLATTGCTGAEPPAPPAVSEPPAQAATLDEVKAAAEKTLSTNGELAERQVMGIGSEGTFGWTTTADLHGPTGNYRAVTGFSADPPELGRMVTGDSGVALEDLTAELLRVGDTMYLTMRAWPPKLRGRWLPMSLDEAATTLASQGMQAGGDRRSPSRLLTLIDSAHATVSRSGPVYRLTVPAPEAVSALGTAALRMLARKQLDVKLLKGDVPVEVTVDAHGRIWSMRLDATDLMRQILDMTGTQVPQGGMETTIELRLANVGKHVSIAAPPADKLIDPAEMGR